MSRNLSQHINNTTIFDTPFGMLLTGRSWEAGSGYRYGFNSQERDDEVYGNGNFNTAEFWGYDTRLGRRWNVDPVVKYNESTYATFANNPLWIIDYNGADSTVYFYPQGFWYSTADPEVVKSIMSSTENLFELNGVKGLKFKYVSLDEAKKLTLDPSDAILGVFQDGVQGMTIGSTERYLNGDGSSIDDFKFAENGYDYEGNYICLTRLESENYNMGMPVSNMEIYAYAAAHEILHQYLNKASLMFCGDYSAFDNGNNGHTLSKLYINLNSEGSLALQYGNLNGNSGIYSGSAFKMYAAHQAAIDVYLKGIQLGLDATGKQKSSTLAYDLIQEWNYKRLVNYPTLGVYAR